MGRIYKILPRPEWEAARLGGVYEGSDVDRADGFIHFSTGEQAQETARRHFAGQPELVVLAVEADDLADLHWEPSRGGELFPHLYGMLDPGLVRDVTEAPLDQSGLPQVGDLA